MKEFPGELKNIEPRKIFDKNDQSDLDSFFLVLGMVFNDLKGIFTFSILMNETYRKPDGLEITAHSGEHGGIRLQINKLVIGIVCEFLIFIEKNKAVVNTIQFNTLKRKLNKDVQDYWDHIYLTAVSSRSKDKNDFLSKINIVRSNITFHYDQSLSQLKEGFIEKFFDTPKNVSNETAYYSLENTMENTRFYYCDGAVEEYLNKHMMVDSHNYMKENLYLIEKINNVIFGLMKEYLEYKQNKK